MGHSHNVPARRHFLKMSARLAALGLTSLGVQPARQLLRPRRRGAEPRHRLQGARVRLHVRRQRRQQPDRAGGQLHRVLHRARRHGGGVALAANTLLPIPGPGGATYGLHPSLTELVPIYNAGYLAFVLNMGALNRPLTKAAVPGRRPGAAQPVLALRPDHAGPDRLRHAVHRVGRATARPVRRHRLAVGGLRLVAGHLPGRRRRAEQRHSSGRQPRTERHELLAASRGRCPPPGGQRDGAHGWRQPHSRGRQPDVRRRSAAGRHALRPAAACRRPPRPSRPPRSATRCARWRG